MIVTCAGGGLVVALLLVLVTWFVVFDASDRGFVLILWGTITGTGSFGSQ